jgi:hypothetical protein
MKFKMPVVNSSLVPLEARTSPRAVGLVLPKKKIKIRFTYDPSTVKEKIKSHPFEGSSSRLAFIDNFTGGGRDNIFYDFDGCRFPGPVRPQQAEANPRLNAETGTVYGDDGFIFFNKVFYFQQSGHWVTCLNGGKWVCAKAV